MHGYAGPRITASALQLRRLPGIRTRSAAASAAMRQMWAARLPPMLLTFVARQASGSAQRSPIFYFEDCTEFSRRNNFLGQRLKTRFSVQRCEEWIYADQFDVISITFSVGLFQAIECLFSITESEVNNRKAVSWNPLLFLQIGKPLSDAKRFVFTAELAVQVPKQRERKRIVAEGNCFLIFRKRIGKLPSQL